MKRLWCFAPLALLFAAACSDSTATPDLPADGSIDAPPGTPDAAPDAPPEDDNAIGQACVRSGNDPKGDCPASHLCVGADGASWCTLRCDGADGICLAGFDGTGVPTCTLSLDDGSTQMLVCTARTENGLGSACTLSATSSQGSCPAGHLCVDDGSGAGTGTCTFQCVDDPSCATGFTGKGEATCSSTATLPNGNAAPVQIQVCAVRMASALGQPCTTVPGGPTQGDCPDGHECVGTDDSDHAGFCTFPCDVANDHCAENYQGPGETFCSYAFLNNSQLPICAIACRAGVDRACPGCDETCPADAACAFQLDDFGPPENPVFPPLDLGTGCL